jgi:hypothetical protein
MVGFYYIISYFSILNCMVLFDFNTEHDTADWVVIDDVVMGGQSMGHFTVSSSGHAVFSGNVSLENNGGFSSVRYQFEQKEIEGYTKITIRLKGDGKRYQFRVKADKYHRHSYIFNFQTSGDWQTIEIPLMQMTPSFRGRKLEMPNYDGQLIEEVAFLIANKQEQEFRLEIDKLALK